MRLLKVKNKYLIELKIPELGKKYDIYIPVNKKLFNVLDLILKVVYEIYGANITKKMIPMVNSVHC